MKRVLCIWLPDWPIQRLIAAQPELKSKPLVLHARDPRRGRFVVAACTRSRQLGVVEGMPLSEIAALTKTGYSQKTTPNLAIHQYQPAQDYQALSELAIWCEQFSPIVGLEDHDPPSCLLLDVTGLADLFGGETPLVELVDQAFQQNGYHVRVGLADTVGAAWALAHYQAPAAARNGKADCDALPIEALRLPAETVTTLHQLGIGTISQLLQLPRHGLATRFGNTLIKRIDQVSGRQAEVIIVHHAPPKFESEWILEHPTDRRNVIESILQRLAENVARTLAQNDHVAVQAQAKLEGYRSACLLEVSLFRPTNDAEHVYDLFQLQLETLQLHEPVRRVHLRAVTTVKLSKQQHLLWDELGWRRDREVAQLVDRLSSRLGKECVFGVQAQASALPEQAYRKKMLVETIRSKHRNAALAAASLKAYHRPLWLHDPPQPLHVTSPTPVANQPPAIFQFQKAKYSVMRYWGPERIETGWWRGRSVRRDYYRVETDQGHRLWLFQQLDHGDWFLHGCFE